MSSAPPSPEPFDLTSADLAAARRDALRAVFPDVFTEGGKVDFDRLKRALGESVDAGKERYGLNWPGKAACFTNIQTPSRATLRPARGESVEFDATGNVIIEGDNLEVLKLLQKSCLGQVKMIYIDPPYNTGNDFIYPDNYAENLETYLRYTGQVDADGQKFSTNPETDGRFHSRWLNMMYPRLYLARNLLRDDGVIFISISDSENSTLSAICNEIFGEENHLATFVWMNEGNIDNQSRIKINHEYILTYARNAELIDAPSVIDPNIPQTSKLFRETIENTIVKNGPANPVSNIELPTGFPANFEAGVIEPKNNFWPRLSNSVHVKDSKTQNTVTASSGWSSKDIAEEFIRSGFRPVRDAKGQETVFYLSDTGALCNRKKRSESQSHVLSILRGMGTVQSSSAKLAELGIAFSYPKPTELIKYLIQIGSNDGDLVLDFFAGSGTVAEAVLKLNQYTGTRKFLLVQLPEHLESGKFQTIAELCRERVSCVSARMTEEDNGKLELNDKAPKPDRGFKVFKLDTSNFLPWNGHAATDGESLRAQLELHVHHLVAGRQSEDLLFELLLKSGYPLTAPLETLTLAGRTVYSVAGGDLLLCLEHDLTDELLRAMAERQPTPGRVVCLDEGFAGQDALKTNAVQTMKTRGVTKFQTV